MLVGKLNMPSYKDHVDPGLLLSSSPVLGGFGKNSVKFYETKVI